MFTFEELKKIEEYFNEPDNKNKLRLEILYALANSEVEIVFRFVYKNHDMVIVFDNVNNMFTDYFRYQVHVGEKKKFIPALNVLITKVKEYIDEKE